MCILGVYYLRNIFCFTDALSLMYLKCLKVTSSYWTLFLWHLLTCFSQVCCVQLDQVNRDSSWINDERWGNSLDTGICLLMKFCCGRFHFGKIRFLLCTFWQGDAQCSDSNVCQWFMCWYKTENLEICSQDSVFGRLEDSSNQLWVPPFQKPRVGVHACELSIWDWGRKFAVSSRFAWAT